MTARYITPIPRPSPNHNTRTCPIDMIVLHYTGNGTLEQVLNKLADPASKVSAHYVVDKDGTVYEMVNPDRRAWHAGVSNWQGKRDINSRSIGIEIINNGRDPYPLRQLDIVAALCRHFIEKHDIPLYNVVGHSDIAPGRKDDPGPLFLWNRLARYKVALMPDATLGDRFRTSKLFGNTRVLREMLTSAGYGDDFSPDPNPSLQDIVKAFQSRYQPWKLTMTPQLAGVPDKETYALLRAVIRANEAEDAKRQQRAHSAQAKNPPKPPGPG